MTQLHRDNLKNTFVFYITVPLTDVATLTNLKYESGCGLTFIPGVIPFVLLNSFDVLCDVYTVENSQTIEHV